MTRFEKTIAMIDAANAADPNRVQHCDGERPAELVYGERMSMMLDQFDPDAPELLRLAARAQHIRRWTVPRTDYPMDRAGYHRWRNGLKRKHAEWAGEILRACGYSDDEIARAGALIRKENLRGDADAQTLEDVACLVFLVHYAADFASKHESATLIEILRKTWSKMSERGRAAARAAPIAAAVRLLLDQSLAGTEPGA